MSAMYQYQFVISPVTEKEVDKIIKAIGYDIDSSDLYGNELTAWGEGLLHAGAHTQERHDEILESLPGKKLISRWRCTEYDEWDEEIEH